MKSTVEGHRIKIRSIGFVLILILVLVHYCSTHLGLACPYCQPLALPLAGKQTSMLLAKSGTTKEGKKKREEEDINFYNYLLLPAVPNAWHNIPFSRNLTGLLGNNSNYQNDDVIVES